VRFVAVKCDLVHSRHLKDRNHVQDSLLSTIRDINKRFASAIAADFVVTHGDECQGLLHEDAITDVVDIIEFVIDKMYPVQVRFGVGLGTLNTSLRKRAIGMDGPAWYNANEALDGAKRERVAARFKGFGAFIGSCRDSLSCADLSFSADQYLSSMLSLLMHVRTRWTLDLRKVTELLQEGKTQVDVAASRGVSAAAVSKRLARAGWREYRDGVLAIRQLLAALVASPGRAALNEAAVTLVNPR
jgi:hypothetical protein